jgi:salicylate hydroxylase
MPFSCVVIGGGIGGLTAALSLLRGGIDVRVFEKAAVLGEVGAGLTLSEGAMQCCIALGIGETVRQSLSLNAGFPFLHYQSGRHLAGVAPLPDAELALPEPGQRGHIYRPDFHRILADAVRSYGDHRIVLGHALTSIDQDETGVTARFGNGASAKGSVLIGADGIRSVVRREAFGEDLPDFTGRVAYRFLVPAEIAEPFLGIGGRACLFVGHGKVFNRYLVSGGRLLNCVGFRRDGDWTEDGWSCPATVDEVLATFQDWHPDVVELIKRAPADRLIKWGVFARPPNEVWTKGRITLLGDAAHPMQPFLGLGAAMAVEDGMILGRALAEIDDPDASLAAYGRARIPRANYVMAASKQQGNLFDTTDPDDYPPANTPAEDPRLGLFDPQAALPG